MKRIIMILGLVVGLMAVPSTATAAEGNDAPCVPVAAYSETVTDEAAYDETVTDKEAYDETVVDHEAYDETVVDEAATFQRYSWNGVNPNDGNAPGFPDERWQANVKGDPNKVGHSGAYFIDRGNQGNGDWFYLEDVDAVTHVVHHDAVTHNVYHEAVTHVVHHEAVTHVVEHPAVTCAVPFPAPEVTDPCGTGNASWVKPVDTEEVHWTIGDAGQLTGETQEGYTWPNGSTINGWGQALETNVELCPVIPEEPPVDICPDVEGDQPAGTDCNPVIPPAEPPVVAPPVDLPPETSTPINQVIVPKVDQPSALPNTGAPSSLIALMGALMLAAGAMTLVTRRKKA